MNSRYSQNLFWHYTLNHSSQKPHKYLRYPESFFKPKARHATYKAVEALFKNKYLLLNFYLIF